MPNRDFLKSKRAQLLLLLAVTAVIIILTVYYRTTMLNNTGFYEPDGFYHFSVIRAAVNNGFSVPSHLSISGYPASAPVNEPQGLYWVTLLPYALLQFFGISYYNIMRLIPVLFGIFDVIGAYFISRLISKDKVFGMLSMLLVALSMGDAARTSALIYRGDGFVTIFLMISLIFAIMILRGEPAEKKESSAFGIKYDKRKAAYAVVSAISLSICNFVWNGAPFATAVYMFMIAFIILLAFVFQKKELLEDSKYLISALGLWYILVNIYVAGSLFAKQTFTGVNTISLLALAIIGWLVAKYLSANHNKYRQALGSPAARFAIAVIVFILAFAAIYLLDNQFIYEIFVGNGFVITSNFAATIQELQSPTQSFLYASFGPVLYTTPMSIVMYVDAAATSVPAIATWILMLLLTIPYLFLQVFDSGDLMSGKAKAAFGLNPGMLVLIAYFAITAYLQINAIRFNSLVSIPLAIFSAYTIYWLFSFTKGNASGTAKYAALITELILFAIFLYILISADILYSNNLSQADNINPQFITAMSWLKNNSAANSVVLTLWPDGSVVEGVANRTSVTDSVGSQNASKANPFAAWLFNASPNPGFLSSRINGRPDYLLARYTWMLETSGIYTESNLTANASLYGSVLLNQFSENFNATTELFRFANPQGLNAVAIIPKNNSASALRAYLLYQQSQQPNTISPFRYVSFYDQDNGNYSIIKQTYYNQTNGDLLLIMYSSVPRPQFPVNITGAYIMSGYLSDINMIKFLFFCGYNACLWNNNQATLKLVYVNQDSKIFRIIYNDTNSTMQPAKTNATANSISVK